SSNKSEVVLLPNPIPPLQPRIRIFIVINDQKPNDAIIVSNPEMSNLSQFNLVVIVWDNW
ncbi:MAG: hypothetical protein P8X88_00985, partial [Gammaproteobacteria bacterium]